MYLSNLIFTIWHSLCPCTFQVPKSQLRYIVGGCLPASSNSSSSEQEEALKEAGYSIWTFPKCSNAVITEFPLRSMLSIIIAPGRVYPALRKYFKVRCTLSNSRCFVCRFKPFTYVHVRLSFWRCVLHFHFEDMFYVHTYIWMYGVPISLYHYTSLIEFRMLKTSMWALLLLILWNTFFGDYLI